MSYERCPHCNPLWEGSVSARNPQGLRDCAQLRDPDCTKCNSDGRIADHSEDEWGMVVYLPCKCTERPDCKCEDGWYWEVEGVEE
jgi:hypothetical protein